MKITILTLFPEVFEKALNFSILKKAQRKHLFQLDVVDIRQFTSDKYKSVDDHPYGGGVGMIMRVDVVDQTISSVKSPGKQKIILLDPRGKLFNQKKAWQYSKLDHLILVCGHYEGIDERIIKSVDEIISIGDFILTGGEIPAMLITDATVRLIPGVLKSSCATLDESFDPQKKLLASPQYTRPRIYKNLKVPSVLLSGNHQKIRDWKETESLKITKKRRPDLL